MAITLQEVQRQLVKLSIHYPEAGHDVEALYSLAEDYYDAFKKWDTWEFNECIKEVRLNCKFWPKIPDIWEAHQSIVKPQTTKMLPDRPPEITAEEAERRAKIAKIYGRVVAKIITMDEADKLVREITS